MTGPDIIPGKRRGALGIELIAAEYMVRHSLVPVITLLGGLYM